MQTDLSNTKIEVISAVTEVNTTTANSRINGSTMQIGAEVANYGDRIFYEDTDIKGEIFRVCLQTATGKIFLDKRNSRRSKSITIHEYKIL
jgi:hypothetical protein